MGRYQREEGDSRRGPNTYYRAPFDFLRCVCGLLQRVANWGVQNRKLETTIIWKYVQFLHVYCLLYTSLLTIQIINSTVKQNYFNVEM